jgi:hypothetical protein
MTSKSLPACTWPDAVGGAATVVQRANTHTLCAGAFSSYNLPASTMVVSVCRFVLVYVPSAPSHGTHTHTHTHWMPTNVWLLALPLLPVALFRATLLPPWSRTHASLPEPQCLVSSTCGQVVATWRPAHTLDLVFMALQLGYLLQQAVPRMCVHHCSYEVSAILQAWYATWRAAHGWLLH